MLLNLVANSYVAVMRAGDMAARYRLAHELAYLRALKPLPIAGAEAFLAVLQLRLRNEPGMASRAEQLAATLPEAFQAALRAMDGDTT